MFFRLLLESFRRQRRRKLLAGIAILLGTTAVTAMLSLATTIGDRIHQELSVYGANIVVYPKAEQLSVKIGGVDIKPTTGNAYLHESDLAKLETIFWAHNITGLSPELQLTLADVSTPAGATAKQVSALGLWFNHPFDNDQKSTGANALHQAWKISGTWPSTDSEVALGSTLARQLGVKTGETVLMPATAHDPQQRHPMHVTGIVDTGDANDASLLLPLAIAQQYLGTPDAVSRVKVLARTKPEDAFGRTDPETLSPAQHEIWYCSPYANSIAYQIREAIPGAAAEQVRQVEQTQGTILARISGLMWFISAAALLSAGFAVSAAMATAILERRGEIGLMRSLGASRITIALLFYAETGLLAILAGTLGYILGSSLAAWLGARIFSDPTLQSATATHLITVSSFNPVLLPVVVATAVLVAIAGSTPSIRNALRMDPSAVLRADA